MNRLLWSAFTLSAGAMLLLAAHCCHAQGALTVKLDPTGLVHVYSGDAELAMIELNAHGTGWLNAPQSSATAQLSDLPGQAGKRCVGTLPVPNTDAALQFSETVRTLPQGLQLEYEVSAAKAVKLNGLQVSVNLPTVRFAGKELAVSQPDGDPQIGAFPLLQQDQNTQVWAGPGDRVAVAKGTADAVTVQMRAATDVLIQDLRRWEHQIFEIRFPAIMEDGGRDVTPDARFHLDLTIMFAGPVKFARP